MCASKECVFTCCLIECSVMSSWVFCYVPVVWLSVLLCQLRQVGWYRIVQVFYILTNFLYSCSINYWEWEVEIFSSSCWIVCFFFQYWKCWFMYFEALFRCAHINFFLKHLPDVVTIFHHEIPLLFSTNISFLKVCFTSCEPKHSFTFKLLLVWDIFFKLCIFASKLCSCYTTYSQILHFPHPVGQFLSFNWGVYKFPGLPWQNTTNWVA